MRIFKQDIQLPVEAIIEEKVAAMIATAVEAAKQEVYAEIADSLKSAGEVDMYNYESMESLAGKYGCQLAGERIEWLTDHATQEELI